MSNMGLDGTARVDPVTFIVTLGGFIPSAFSIFNAALFIIGLLMLANAIFRQIDTARGRSEHTAAQNFMHGVFGGALAVTAELIGSYGKGLMGADFQSASVLMYVGKDESNMAKTAMGAFLYLCQFIGAMACAYALILADRLSTSKPNPGETWASVFWFAAGGLGLVFVHHTIGILSSITGMRLARFINNL